MTTLEDLLNKPRRLRNGTIYYPDLRVTRQEPKRDGQHVIIHSMQGTWRDEVLEYIVNGDNLTPYRG